MHTVQYQEYDKFVNSIFIGTVIRGPVEPLKPKLYR